MILQEFYKPNDIKLNPPNKSITSRLTARYTHAAVGETSPCHFLQSIFLLAKAFNSTQLFNLTTKKLSLYHTRLVHQSVHTELPKSKNTFRLNIYPNCAAF